MDTSQVFAIEVETLNEMRQNGEAHNVLDVREDWEVAQCALPDSLHIPMSALMMRVQELPRNEPLIVICHHGVRSMQVTAWLRHNGFDNAINLQGGIDAWAKRIDQTMATY